MKKLATICGLTVKRLSLYCANVDMHELSTLIRQQLERSGSNPFRAAMQAQLPENAIRTVLSGREPKVGRLAEICDALGLEFYVGPPRVEPADNGSQSTAPRKATAQTNGAPPTWAREGFASLQKAHAGLQKELRALTERLEAPQAEHGLSMLTFVQEADSLEDDTATGDPDAAPAAYRPVAVAEMDAAAGGGAWDPDERVTKWVYFRREWLDRHAIQPNLCRVIGVRGESMGETLRDGCSILVDLGRRRRREGRIYVVRTDEGVVVKRAGKDDEGNWVLISDNRAWEDRLWESDDTTIGEVRWMARTLG